MQCGDAALHRLRRGHAAARPFAGRCTPAVLARTGGQQQQQEQQQQLQQHQHRLKHEHQHQRRARGTIACRAAGEAPSAPTTQPHPHPPPASGSSAPMKAASAGHNFDSANAVLAGPCGLKLDSWGKAAGAPQAPPPPSSGPCTPARPAAVHALILAAALCMSMCGWNAAPALALSDAGAVAESVVSQLQRQQLPPVGAELELSPVEGQSQPRQPPPAGAQLSVVVSIKPGTPGATLAALGPSPTLFLTARPVSLRTNQPYASRRVVLAPPQAAAPGDGASPGLPLFPRTEVLGGPEDLLVPQEQYRLLEDVLRGVDITVSARLDKDGDPNTRDADDLVGRGVYTWDPSEMSPTGTRKVYVQLEGRGLFGRLVTSRS
ncbi:hypothetical protein FOA52_012084 [Chlamydomonas sp. UWO 241]|nr:hypothetical protein FOA52_012084 [Chlamydomonas sp. UWO 241]